MIFVCILELTEEQTSTNLLQRIMEQVNSCHTETGEKGTIFLSHLFYLYESEVDSLLCFRFRDRLQMVALLLGVMLIQQKKSWKHLRDNHRTINKYKLYKPPYQDQLPKTGLPTNNNLDSVNELD